jgi:hypothetical protein
LFLRIDALCINQDDVAERHAERVRIWGLEIDPDISDALNAYSNLAQETEIADISFSIEELRQTRGRIEFDRIVERLFGL